MLRRRSGRTCPRRASPNPPPSCSRARNSRPSSAQRTSSLCRPRRRARFSARPRPSRAGCGPRPARGRRSRHASTRLASATSARRRSRPRYPNQLLKRRAPPTPAPPGPNCRWRARRSWRARPTGWRSRPGARLAGCATLRSRTPGRSSGRWRWWQGGTSPRRPMRRQRWTDSRLGWPVLRRGGQRRWRLRPRARLLSGSTRPGPSWRGWRRTVRRRSTCCSAPWPPPTNAERRRSETRSPAPAPTLSAWSLLTRHARALMPPPRTHGAPSSQS
mmetsp:Transcript_1633/g.5263  ORF Transcript_1633/g.5263 Transcript_1633/m.5263 type:complete len:274 (+) Transcript_1633:163-984(+)